MAASSEGVVASATVVRILDVAEDLFANKGFTETTLRDIAAPLGLTSAGVLHSFGKKSRIYAAVLERVAATLEHFVDEVEQASKDGCAAQLKHLFLGFVDWTQTYPSYNRLTLRELLDNRERMLHAQHWPLAPALRRLIAVLERGQAFGVLRNSDPAITLFHIIGSATYFDPALPTIAATTHAQHSPKEFMARYRSTVLDMHLRALLIEPDLARCETVKFDAQESGRLIQSKTPRKTRAS